MTVHAAKAALRSACQSAERLTIHEATNKIFLGVHLLGYCDGMITAELQSSVGCCVNVSQSILKFGLCTNNSLSTGFAVRFLGS